jgi:endoglucanase
MNKDNKKFFKSLVEAPSPSGFEQPAQRIYREFTNQYADEVKTDVHGSVYALKKGSGKLNIMVCGHADEIGLMVKYINDKGFVYFSPIGGVDPTNLPGSRVDIHHEGKVVRGIVGRKAIHLLSPDERGKVPKLSAMYIDIGAKDKKDAEKKVSIGDPITFSKGMESIGKDIVTTKAADNKVGVYIAAMLLKELEGKTVVPNIYSVSAVQEEVGLRGSTTSAFNINPDVAIAIDVTHATDTPDTSKVTDGDVDLGKGPSVAVGAAINPKVFELLKEAAKEQKIDIQVEPCSNRTGTDTDAIQLSRGGVATGLISIPTRYMHTPSEVISLKDVDDSVKLIAAFIEKINDETSFIPE